MLDPYLDRLVIVAEVVLLLGSSEKAKTGRSTTVNPQGDTYAGMFTEVFTVAIAAHLRQLPSPSEDDAVRFEPHFGVIIALKHDAILEKDDPRSVTVVRQDRESSKLATDNASGNEPGERGRQRQRDDSQRQQKL